MNTERLLRLADHLDTVPPEAFDMGSWASETPCGTTCCALGHACSIPEFQAAGLRLEWDNPIINMPERRALVTFATGTFGRLGGFGAAREFFGLGNVQARYLFHPDRYHDADGGAVRPTPKDVAARVRGLVAGGAA